MAFSCRLQESSLERVDFTEGGPGGVRTLQNGEVNPEKEPDLCKPGHTRVILTHRGGGGKCRQPVLRMKGLDFKLG